MGCGNTESPDYMGNRTKMAMNRVYLLLKNKVKKGN